MNNIIKITNEELEELHKLKNEIQKTVFEFGELYLEKMELDMLYTSLSEKEKKLRDKHNLNKKNNDDLMNKILLKYGEGSLSLSTGTFVPEKKL